MTMPAMLTELYDALRGANVPEDKARAAAQAVLASAQVTRDDLTALAASIKEQVWRVEKNITDRLTHLETTFGERLARVETILSYHKWLFGIVIALQVAIALKLFWP